MNDDLGVFRTRVGLSAFPESDRRIDLDDVMVDTGSTYSWFPEDALASTGVSPVYVEGFRATDGRVVTRKVGFAVICAVQRAAACMVVFAEPGDLTLLGAHALGGLNVRIDHQTNALVPAGPAPAAAA